MARTRVAFQGERGAYGEEAIRAHFGDTAEPVPVRSFARVAESIRAGEARFGVLPLRNSIVGGVAEARAVLAGSGLHELGTVEIPVRHCLLALPGATIHSIRTIESHPVALAQCSRYLGRLPRVEVRPAYDTAGAARDIALAGNETRAAVAGATAARLYSLSILATGIADSVENLTTFAVLGA
jgi:prephenate dehydratase